MKLKLTKGYEALVDDDAPADIVGRKWTASVYPSGRVYVVATKVIDGKKKRVYLHRMLADAKEGQQVDHINGDGLDNRLCNLRLCTMQQNVWNQKKKRKSLSKYKGVAQHHDGYRWVARLTLNGKNLYLGTYENEQRAAIAYDAAAKLHYGSYAACNFPL